MPFVEEVLGPHGPLAATLPGYEARPGQIAMAQAIQRGFAENVHVLVEAGTGIGKSFGYLVPALTCGRRVVISTATHALQEQLLTKDIPRVVAALGLPSRVVLLKGRNNYLCMEKLDQMRSRLVLARTREERDLLAWATATAGGDRAELNFVPSSRLWDELDADADDCLMEACRFFGPERCHLMRAREAARHADIIVVNHALFFSDLAAGGGIIPAYDCAILDEAHQVEEWATAAFTTTISRGSVGRLVRKLHRSLSLDPLLEEELVRAADAFTRALAAPAAPRYAFGDNPAAWETLEPLQRALYRLEDWVIRCWASASRLPRATEEVCVRRRDALLKLIVGHTQTIERLRRAGEEWMCWVEPVSDDDAARAAYCAPASIAAALRELLFDRVPSVVLTSATIADAGDFSYVRRQVGLESARVEELVVPSPFDYPRQALLYLPRPSLNPKDPRFAERAAPILTALLHATRGRAFVLCTSLAMMHALASHVGPGLPFPWAVQGDRPKGALLRWFRENRHAVLFATASFWEGVDVIGSALSCVVIDRLPFPPPDDPVIAARSRSLAAEGADPFGDLMLPVAITKLKQGLGRLIRSTSDRGIMCILDGRLEHMPYGRRILAALPPARRTHGLDDVRAFLAEQPA